MGELRGEKSGDGGQGEIPQKHAKCFLRGRKGQNHGPLCEKARGPLSVLQKRTALENQVQVGLGGDPAFPPMRKKRDAPGHREGQPRSGK